MAYPKTNAKSPDKKTQKKSPAEVLIWIVDILSKGGNYMLNIGPKGDGSIPEDSVRILREVGVWLALHRDAIYGTCAWTVPRSGPTPLSMKGTHTPEENGFQARFTPDDVWFTRKDDSLFAFSLLNILPEQLTLDAFPPTNVREVTHMSSGLNVPFRTENGEILLETAAIQVPDLAHVFRIGLH